MQNTNTKEVEKLSAIEQLCVVHVDFDIWSGQTRLSGSDIKLGDGGELPPEKVAKLGSKTICDPSKLKGFHKLKTRTRRLLLQFGLPFMNGFAVPVKAINTICAELDKIKDEFNEIRSSFLSSYNRAVDEWAVENPEYENAIRTGTVPLEQVEKKIACEYNIFMIQPTANNELLSNQLHKKVNGLGDDLVSEIVQEANRFYTENLAGNRDRCSINTKASLVNIKNKVEGLAFLNRSFGPLVNLLDQTVAGYKTNTQGRNIFAPFIYQVSACVLIMCDKKRIDEYADGTITVDSMVAQHSQSAALWGIDSDEPDVIEDLEVTKDLEEDVQVVAQSTEVVPEPIPVSIEPIAVEAEVVEVPEINKSEDSIDDEIDAFFKSLEENGSDEVPAGVPTVTTADILAAITTVEEDQDLFF